MNAVTNVFFVMYILSILGCDQDSENLIQMEVQNDKNKSNNIVLEKNNLSYTTEELIVNKLSEYSRSMSEIEFIDSALDFIVPTLVEVYVPNVFVEYIINLGFLQTESLKENKSIVHELKYFYRISSEKKRTSEKAYLYESVNNLSNEIYQSIYQYLFGTVSVDNIYDTAVNYYDDAYSYIFDENVSSSESEYIVINVTRLSELKAEVSKVREPTLIKLKNATYTGDEIVLSGNKAKVIIEAESLHRAVIQVPLILNSNNITIRNMKFSGGEIVDISGGRIIVNASFCKISNNLWDNSQAIQWITVDDSAYNVEIAYNKFQNKYENAKSYINWGHQTVQLKWESDNKKAHNHYVHHNHWKNIVRGRYDNTYESLQLYTKQDGVLAAEKGANQNIRVEYNLFEDANGETEIISIKGNGMKIRNNRFINSDGFVKLRFGNNSEISNNIIISDKNKYKNSGGISISGQNHKVFGNYIANVANECLSLVDGDNYWAGHSIPTNIEIKSNVTINCGRGSLRIGADLKRAEQIPAVDILVKDNIFIKDNSNYLVQVGSRTKNPLSGISFINNRFDTGLISKLEDGFIQKNINFSTVDSLINQANNISIPDTKEFIKLLDYKKRIEN